MPPYIDIHTHRPDADAVSVLNVRLQSPDPTLPYGEFFSAGIHPWDTTEAQENWLDILESSHSGLLAIGETGLDLRPAYPPHDTQQKWFERQAAMADRLGKPLIIHNVRATDKIMTLLAKHPTVPAILHGFTGSPELARQWLQRCPEVRFSFGPAVLHSPKTQEALRWVVTEWPAHFFLETDDDPEIKIREMYTFAAGLTNPDIGWIKKQISMNFNTLFPQITI